MVLFGGAVQITGITFQLFVVFAVILVGYLIGRIDIKGISLGTAGVFIAALLFGAMFSAEIHKTMTLSGDDITSNAFKIIENAGLILFVGSVGMIAGPGFFRNLKKNYKSYILLGVVIILGGLISSIACYYAGIGSVQLPSEMAELGITEKQYMISMITGIMSGALTSTPAFSAAQATAASLVPAEAADTIQDVITIGHAIAYIFGVVGVVLFVQVVPRLLKADMTKERQQISAVDSGERTGENKGRFQIDGYGFAAFGLVAVVGIFIGMIQIPLSAKGLSGTAFSLTTTGGVLISGLVISHFGHIGPVSMKADRHVLEVFREFGLVFFLIGAGIPGGASFVKYFHAVYFLYGMIITVVPMIIGYAVAKYLLRLPLLNTLGSITGGMTSTPALGALIRSAGTDDVASSYASTYPIALICVVLASQFLLLLFGS
ncbi:MAG: permease [Oscillospiraceae bacterium]|nr:permease [Oscillospiraceae bacterium]